MIKFIRGFPIFASRFPIFGDAVDGPGVPATPDSGSMWGDSMWGPSMWGNSMWQ